MHIRTGTAFLASALAGAIFQLGFEPTHWVPVGIVGLSLWLWVLSRAESWRALAVSGIGFGLTWFGLGLQWTVNTMTEHGHLPMVVAQLGTFALALLLSISPTITALIVGARRQQPAFVYALQWAGTFTLMEWVRGEGLMHFGWLSPSHMLVGTLWDGWLPIGGEYALNLVMLFTSATLWGLIVGRNVERVCFVLAGVLMLGLGWQAKALPWEQQRDHMTVLLVQPNMPVVDAFMRVRPMDRIAQLDRLLTQQGTNQQAEERPDLTLIPEGIVNVPLSRLTRTEQEALRVLTQKAQSPVLMNAFRVEGEKIFNTSFVLNPDGVSYYVDKRHLVPFGEFVPTGFHWFVNLLGFPMADLSAGDTKQPGLTLNGMRVAFMICYENLFGSLSRSWWLQPGHPNVVAVTANLGWFGPSIHAQYLAMTRMRAMEVALPFVSVANNGWSAVVDPKGNVLERLPMGEERVQTVKVPLYSCGSTPYTRQGPLPVLILSLLVSLFGLYERFWVRKRPARTPD